MSTTDNYDAELLEQQMAIVARAIGETNRLRGEVRRLKAEAAAFPGAMWEMQERIELLTQQLAARG